MNKDRIIGLLIFIGSILGIIIYAWLLFFISPIIVIQITLFIAVSAILAILSWIGYTLETTPPPKPIEEIEKEIEGELKKEEKMRQKNRVINDNDYEAYDLYTYGKLADELQEGFGAMQEVFMQYRKDD